MAGSGRIARAFGLMLMLVFSLLAMPATAHEPSTYTVIVRDGSHAPNQVSILLMDTVQYYDVDDRENITHHIGLDINGDGDFEDEGEFSSGPLSGFCDWENDSVCRRAWILPFNSSDMVGEYAMTDYVSDGTEIHVLLTVVGDSHTPDTGGCVGDECNTEPTTDVSADFESTQLLLVGGVFMLILGVLLAVWIAEERSHPDLPNDGNDEEY